MVKSIRAGLSVVLAATLILTLPNDEASGAAGFSDVPHDYLFAEQVNWLVAENITRGCNPPANDRFCPDEPVTRGQMAAFLFRALSEPNWWMRLSMVSIAYDGTDSGLDSYSPAISADGRYVAFHSAAPNLVPGDGNGRYDVFVHDRITAHTVRVSISSTGAEGNASSVEPAISGDGRYVVFVSDASNLVPDDTNSARDVFVHDRETAETHRVSVGFAGAEGDGSSERPAISADGRHISFDSVASNLVLGDFNRTSDAFVHDRIDHETVRVSVASDGTEGNNQSSHTAISADGCHVAFQSEASNLVPGDGNSGLYAFDIFVRDCDTQETVRVSVASDGTEGDDTSEQPAISADGTVVAFQSGASNLVAGDTKWTMDVCVHDRTTQTTTQMSVASDGTPANRWAESASITGDGRYVAFATFISLDPADSNGDYDIYVHDRDTGLTRWISMATGGFQGDNPSYDPALSADGRHAAFGSKASNLVLGDIGWDADIFATSL
ncbi:MAG: S-layer homology domain-containing protein [Acidimicrobiia bacterium]|nr:S-layer homology domain-containing protein [Acidimicrobiia bacterium]